MAAPPRWLTPALALWTILGAVALANITAVPVSLAGVLVVLLVLTLAQGALSRRWRVAGPFALVTTALMAAILGHAFPADWHFSATGPADATAPKVIWAAAYLVAGFDIAWGLFVHRRFAPASTVDPATLHREADVLLHRHLDNLTARVASLEDTLTSWH